MCLQMTTRILATCVCCTIFVSCGGETSRSVQSETDVVANTSKQPNVAAVAAAGNSCDTANIVIDRARRDVNGIIVIGSGLSDDEIAAIEKTIASMASRLLNESIVAIEHKSQLEVEVVTEVDGPLDCGGSIVKLRKQAGLWDVIAVLGWKS